MGSRSWSLPSSSHCRSAFHSPKGNAAVIAAGTGLGEALLHNVDGRFIPAASEGGHADFAARTPREMDMVRALGPIFERVGVELVISGPGLLTSISSRTTHLAQAPRSRQTASRRRDSAPALVIQRLR